MKDPLEQEIEDALNTARVKFIRESEESKFPRINEQCERDHNVIVIQGVKSARLITELLSGETKVRPVKEDFHSDFAENIGNALLKAILENNEPFADAVREMIKNPQDTAVRNRDGKICAFATPVK